MSKAMQWVKASDRNPEGVTSFKTMSKFVAVHYFDEYDQEIRTASGRYCHDRKKWFVGGQNSENNNECNVIEWLDESESGGGMAEALEDLLAAIPKQSNDADWWPDELTSAVERAEIALGKP